MSSQIIARLASLGHTLPPAPTPVAAYVSYVISGNTLYVSGQLSTANGSLHTGKVAADNAEPLEGEISIADAKSAATKAALNLLAQADAAAKGLENISQVVKISVFVNSNPKFTKVPEIANAASEILLQIFPEKIGAHARSAIGTATLPLGAAVEIEGIFEIKH